MPVAGITIKYRQASGILTIGFLRLPLNVREMLEVMINRLLSKASGKHFSKIH